MIEVVAEPEQPDETSRPVPEEETTKLADNSLYYSIGAVCVAAVIIVGAVCRKRKTAKSVDSIAADDDEVSEE